MDTAHWPQVDLGLVKPMEELFSSAAAGGGGGGRPSQTQPLMGGGERRARPQKEQPLGCPRCSSTNTKFCYYNNYSLTQPRYFCKSCRRYWTEGGSLRNVPVGGGSRKNKRPSSSAAAAASTASSARTAAPEQNPRFDEGQDLNLASGAMSAMELLRSTCFQGRSLSPFVPMHPVTTMAEYHQSSGFGVQDFRPSSQSFTLDASASGVYGGFPFGESRPVAGGGGGGGQSGGEGAPPPTGFWNGLMGSGAGGGSSW